MRFLIVAALLAGCAAAGDKPQQTVFTYKCEDGTAFKAEFKADSALITLKGGQTLILPQMVAASGIRYATPRHELRGKGRDAMWTVGRKAATACKAL